MNYVVNCLRLEQNIFGLQIAMDEACVFQDGERIQ
jgi:hypothetical protein